MKTLTCLLIVFIVTTTAIQATETKQIAVTMDDLPGWEPVYEGSANKIIGILAETLKYEKVPATGFVIGALAARTIDSKKSLQTWAEAGLALANHSWDHPRYSKTSTQEFWNGVLGQDIVS